MSAPLALPNQPLVSLSPNGCHFSSPTTNLEGGGRREEKGEAKENNIQRILKFLFLPSVFLSACAFVSANMTMTYVAIGSISSARKFLVDQHGILPLCFMPNEATSTPTGHIFCANFLSFQQKKCSSSFQIHFQKHGGRETPKPLLDSVNKSDHVQLTLSPSPIQHNPTSLLLTLSLVCESHILVRGSHEQGSITALSMCVNFRRGKI